jgi:hypothetical protein
MSCDGGQLFRLQELLLELLLLLLGAPLSADVAHDHEHSFDAPLRSLHRRQAQRDVDRLSFGSREPILHLLQRASLDNPPEGRGGVMRLHLVRQSVPRVPDGGGRGSPQQPLHPRIPARDLSLDVQHDNPLARVGDEPFKVIAGAGRALEGTGLVHEEGELPRHGLQDVDVLGAEGARPG